MKKGSKQMPNILVKDGWKHLRSQSYNYDFNMKNGFFRRWGARIEDDPDFSPFGPEILDIEISVNGCPNKCPFCYKGNTNEPPTNMSLETFKKILDKMGPQLTQLALGITGLKTNPDLFPIMEYARSKHVIPNFTMTGVDLNDDIAKKTAKLAGAVAVSVHPWDKDVGYDTVKKMTDLGMTQVNIHLVVSEQSYDFLRQVLQDRKTDPRLAKMYAIIFLRVKPKGRAKDHYQCLSSDKFMKLIKASMDMDVPFGFDSCSAGRTVRIFKKMNLEPETLRTLVESCEPCESSLFSAYINVHGQYTHCSFCEGETKPIDVLQPGSFKKLVWDNQEVAEFRKKLLAKNRECPVYELKEE